jgi:hypothetical protein
MKKWLEYSIFELFSNRKWHGLGSWTSAGVADPQFHCGLHSGRRQGPIVAQPNDRSGARWLTGDGAVEKGARGEFISGLTGARVAVWRLVRAVLDRGNNRKIVEGGAVDDDGALPFYRGRGGGWEWHMTVVNECLLGCRYLE